jgi:hypothetical protein
MELFRGRNPGGERRAGGFDLVVDGATLAARGGDQAVAVPVVDLPPGPAVSTEPYRSARRVYWIVDNGSSHNGKRSVDRMRAAWPKATLIHLPVHASWLNQIEIVFSVIQRKVIKPADFAHLAELGDHLERFTDRYNATATPFQWRFTSADLAKLLERVDTHELDRIGLPAAA